MGFVITEGGYDLFEAVSALQKTIRRGLEEEAMFWALEIQAKQPEYLWTRLKVIANEDIGIADASVIILIDSLDRMRKDFMAAKKEGPVRLCLANAILSLCRCQKSRIADHFQCVIRGRRLDGLRPDVPDYALDKHTKAGKRRGRGWDHWRTEGCKLENKSGSIDDPYEKEAHEHWSSGKMSPPKKSPLAPLPADPDTVIELDFTQDPEG